METRLRSLAKSVSWRFVAALLTFGTSWAVTGSVSFALTIGAIEVVGKTLLFYVHERLWLRVPLGRPAGADQLSAG